MITGNVIFVEGTASWYAEFSPGINKNTANGEVFDDSRKTCAIWGVPFNSVIEITNLENQKSVTVRVNDRGPARRLLKRGRKIDLTMAAFREIADLDQGLAKVRLKIIK